MVGKACCCVTLQLNGSALVFRCMERRQEKLTLYVIANDDNRISKEQEQALTRTSKAFQHVHTESGFPLGILPMGNIKSNTLEARTRASGGHGQRDSQDEILLSHVPLIRKKCMMDNARCAKSSRLYSAFGGGLGSR